MSSPYDIYLSNVDLHYARLATGPRLPYQGLKWLPKPQSVLPKDISLPKAPNAPSYFKYASNTAVLLKKPLLHGSSLVNPCC